MLRRLKRKKHNASTPHSPARQSTPRKSLLTLLRSLLYWKRAFKASSEFTPLYGENWPIEMRPQAYVETPQHRRIEWVDACGGPHRPLGKLPASLRVGVIGGGPAGVTTAFEAVKAGAQVTLIEARHEVGGCARSVELSDKNLAEQGCMRFPPSASALFVLAKAFGLLSLSGFQTLEPCPLWYPTETNAIYGRMLRPTCQDSKTSRLVGMPSSKGGARSMAGPSSPVPKLWSGWSHLR